ncbi:unnamed protein product [Cladocopium goreaui]|uniref:Uncharacterized protein n=1 Tax=Cladocopium goreaui TaxID=2562237 RepID=A0A9P1DSS4_9DINO|nr:unnamed protein product [Cladocopium goreaui]
MASNGFPQRGAFKRHANASSHLYVLCSWQEKGLSEAKAEELEQEMQRVEVLSTSATSKRSRTLMMTNGLRQDRIRWGWKLQELQRRLQCLVGDALLSAAATELLGTYGPQHREELLEHWKEVLERLSIPHSKDFDLASYWIVPTARYRLHTELALPKDIHLEESLVFACLQTSKWPVFYDPDHLAPGFLQKFFPGAVRLTMGSTDFQKDLLSSLSSRAVTSPSDVSEVLGQVIIIENAYLPAIRDTDILTELVARRQLVAAGLQTAGLVQLSAGVEDTVVHVDPRIVLIFITDMGEPWNHDAMSKNFLMIDFQLTREDGLSGPLMDLMTDTVCAKAMPSVQQARLGPEFSQLMAEWYRQDKELIQDLVLIGTTDRKVEFPTEEQLRETMNLKMNLESVGRKLLKTRDSEVKLQQQRATHDLLVSSLCAMAVAAEEIFNLCPASSIPLSGAWRVCEEFMPEPPPEDRKKSNRDSDYAGMARRAVLAGLWERISPGLPRQFALAAALRLTMASAMPQKPLQEILGTLLLQCPAGDPRVFQHSLNGLLCSAMQAHFGVGRLTTGDSWAQLTRTEEFDEAILQGRGLSDALQQYRQVEGAPQNPRASFRTLFEIQGSTGRQSSKSNGTDSRSGSKTMASVNRSMMSLGNLAFSEMDEESEEEQEHSASKRRSSTAETAAALRAAGEKGIPIRLLQQLFVANKGHWSHCNSKQIFLARFAYFQETLRCQLEHCIRDEAPEDLFRVNRMELFGIDEKHLEDLLAEAPHRENKDFMARRSTRNLVTPVDEGGENVAEGADTPQLFSLLLHFGASFGHGACGPWTLQLHVDSVNNDPGAWARWAESIATQNYRKGMTGHNALSESETWHLPLLASLPHELLSSLLPQGFLQTILFSVLASFSLSAVLHASELIVAGATGNATPLRCMSLPRLLEPEGTHRSAVPVVCLCDSEASSVVENIHRIHQAKESEAGRKVIQLSLTDLVANSTTGKAGQSAGERPNCWSSISPAAECASTPSGVLELLEECKDLGYWLLLHVQIWFTCSTPSFQSTADEKFRLFVIIDCRCPVALPSWLFRCGRSELCVVDSAGTPSLRSWLEEALDAMPRRAQSFLSSMVLPAAPAGKARSVATGFKTLTDAANASQLAAEGKMGRVMMSPVLCSKLAQPNFPLKLQTSGQRLAMLVLAAACDGGLWPKCILKTRSIGGPRVAEVVEELNFDVTLRSVDMLEIFAPLALQQAHKCPVWPDTSSFPGFARSDKCISQDNSPELDVKSASAPRKSRKNIDVQDLDELLWYHDEHFESKDSAWKVFATLVEAMERISNQGVQTIEAEIPGVQSYRSTERGQEERTEMDDVEVDEVQESPLSTKRKVSGVQTLQFQIPSMGQLPSSSLSAIQQIRTAHGTWRCNVQICDLGSSSEGDQEESPEGSSRAGLGPKGIPARPAAFQQILRIRSQERWQFALGRRVVDAHSASRMALVELLKADLGCHASLCRRERSRATQNSTEALALIRGLEGECMSPKMSLKLRHLLHSADLWAARAEPEDTISAPPVSTRLLPNCPIEVFHVAKSHAAATFPVPDGWQPPHFRDEANFGSWLSHLAMQLYQVYVSDSVPRNLHISELAQLEPLLLSLRLCLAGQKNLQVEQTCMELSGASQETPQSLQLRPGTYTVSEDRAAATRADFSTWDELRPPAFKATCKLSQQLAAAMAPLFAEKVEAPRISLADGAGSPGSAGSPSAASATTAGATSATGAGQPDGERKSMSATFTKSVRKVAMMASLSAKPGRRSTVRPGTKKLKEKDPTFVQKEISEEDLVLQGLLADGAVWSTQGLHIDSNVAGVTRLPPLRVVAATLKAAEYMYSQAFPQAVGCMNLFVHRLFGSPWPLPTEGLLPRSSVEMWTVRLPFWSKPQNRWQPVMLLDGMGPSAAPGHLRQWEDDLCDSTIFSRSMEDHLEESLSVARPFGLLPTDSLLSAMAGPPMLSRRKAEKVKKKLERESMQR